MKKIIIAIDGYSSTGKSTLAKMLAEHLDYIYIDSGAMYRAIAFFAIQNNLFANHFLEKEKLIERIPEIELHFKKNKETHEAELFLNGVNIHQEIRSIEVSNCVSWIAEIPEVRKKLVEQQQAFGKKKGIVMDGRDIGTVVFPDAELKLFLTATPEERAKRRYLEFQKKGESVLYEEVFKNVTLRDTIDTTRKDSPLIQAADAILIDNTHTNIQDQFYTALQLAKDRIAGRV